MTTFAISDFVRRQTWDSEFSYFVGSDKDLLKLTRKSFKNAKPGYRDGVVLVPVDSAYFFCGSATLEEGDKLVGEYKARREGEAPAKVIRVVGREKAPAVAVDIILYRHDVLAEDDDRSSDAEWEIISINARHTLDEMPIAVGTLMRNYFCEDGGTDTKMTAEEFVAQLKVSRKYWRDKILVAPRDKV